MRVQTETGGSRSLFYGYPSSGDGQGPPLFHAYLGYLRSDEISGMLRNALSEKLPFVAKGKHTMELVVTKDNSEELRKALRGLLELAREYAVRDE